MKSLLQLLNEIVQDACAQAGIDRSYGVVTVSDRPDLAQFQCNGALAAAKAHSKNPREIAQKIVDVLAQQNAFSALSIAGPGFINLTVTDALLYAHACDALNQQVTPYAGQEVVIEYSDPNPFKILHAGHLYTSIVGYAISQLLERGGARVHRVNFGGDVGLHVAKTLWAIIAELGGEHPEKLEQIALADRSQWLADCYVRGNNTYEENPDVQEEVKALNKKVYDLHTHQDTTSPLAQLYWTCRQWSYDSFNAFYKRIGTPFEKYYAESECAPIGEAIVREQLAAGVYEESDGAIVFPGEKYGLHTRVFINSQGLPTYEAKDIGLVMLKWEEYHFDRSIVITGNEQQQYMSVVLKSLEQFAPALHAASTHVTHGMVKLAGGVKMSSRKGNIVKALDVLDAAAQASEKIVGRSDDAIVLGAIQYSFLKNRIGADIVYDPEEAASLEGNSGPYLQYAHARARSIGEKGGDAMSHTQDELDDAERRLALKICEYPTVIEQAVQELLPHGICTYLYELAQTFNYFYEHSRVIGDKREEIRLALVRAYADILRDGLELLHIDAPEKV